MSFDIALLDTKTLSDAGVQMTLVHLKTGEPLMHTKENPGDPDKPVTITVHGRQSQVFRDWLRATQATRAQEAAARQKQNLPALSAEELAEQAEADNNAMMIACTEDWSFTELHGKPFPCTEANKRLFYTDPRFRSYRQQVFDFIMADSNFLAKSLSDFKSSPATSSSPTSHSRTAAHSPRLSEASA